MSQRTIVEFNHDFAAEIKERPEEFADALVNALSSGMRRSWDGLKRYGVARIVQRHHSDGCKVNAHGHVYDYKTGWTPSKEPSDA